MSQGLRLLRAQRCQPGWGVIDLDSQLDPEHRARVVWDFVRTMELSALYVRIKAAGDAPGRPASDPAVLLAVWLYATVEGVGSARAIERLCEHHTAYRWLCGGVPVNHDMLSVFRRESGGLLDQLLTQSLTSLLAEGLITLEEVAIDGTKTQAHASRGSLAQRDRLVRLEATVAEQVAKLKRELEADGAAGERKQRERALRAAEERAARLRRAQENLAQLEQEKAERAKRHAKEEAEKRAPSVSISDPEVRSMKMADGATRLAWNVQVATSNGFIVTIDPTDRRNDSGLAEDLVQQVVDRCGVTPQRLLADGSAMTQDDIVGLSQSAPHLDVFSPPPTERQDVTAETLRKRVWKHRNEPAPVQRWRKRMASEAGKLVYRRRKLTEHAHAKMKNRGFGRMLVNGLATVRCVCLLHALALNLLNAHRLRLAAA
jgi:transposase